MPIREANALSNATIFTGWNTDVNTRVRQSLAPRKKSGDRLRSAFHFFSGTVNTTSPEPMLPAASRTCSTRTYVPGFSASVLKRNVSVLLSNRPSAGKTLVHFLPLTANDAAGQAHQRIGRRRLDASAWSPSTPATFTVTVGGTWRHGNGALIRSPVRASSAGLSLRSLATTLS